MKKNNLSVRYITIVFLVLAFTFVSSFCFGAASADDLMKPGTPDGISTFPTSLQRIESEAFAGTGFKCVKFQDSLQIIGDQAFEGSSNLRDAYIPKSVVFIGSDAIPNDVLIHGIDDSYACKWAVEYGYRFVVDDIWHSNCPPQIFDLHLLLILFCFTVPAPPQLAQMQMIRKAFVKSMRPQDRPELYPIDYRFP